MTLWSQLHALAASLPSLLPFAWLPWCADSVLLQHHFTEPSGNDWRDQFNEQKSGFPPPLSERLTLKFLSPLGDLGKHNVPKISNSHLRSRNSIRIWALLPYMATWGEGLGQALLDHSSVPTVLGAWCLHWWSLLNLGTLSLFLGEILHV